MIPVLSQQQIKTADEFTIINEPVSSLNLMERAATKCVEFIISKFSNENKFIVVCGSGNNGGDGLVIARLLLQKEYLVHVLIFDESYKRSIDFEENLKRLFAVGFEGIKVLRTTTDLPQIDSSTIVIDAIFGTGISRKPEGIFASTISWMNEKAEKIISIDMPSGLYCDEPTPELNLIVKANITLTFQVPKFAFFMPENGIYTGEFFILDIGLNADFIKDCKTNFYLITQQDIASILEPRSGFSHKGNFGHAVLLAGSEGKMGAAIMAAKSCLRSGVGLLTVQVPRCGGEVFNAEIPEAMSILDESETHLSNFKLKDKYTALGIGPGIGQHEETKLVMKLVIQNTDLPMVVDADALNILSENKTWLSFFKNETILTPHIGEFERMFGKFNSHFERLECLRSMALKHGITIVLKGKFTCVATSSGKCFFNPTGNPGMAKGGSGDVLTGMLTALVAQGYTGKDAAIAGVYLHGLAADLALEKQSYESLLATDVIDHIGSAYKLISASEKR